MMCGACMHVGDDFIQVRQVGVNNYHINGELKEPEIYFILHICPVCGVVQVDLRTIKTKVVKGIWGD